jgi:hypothetical protein
MSDELIFGLLFLLLGLITLPLGLTAKFRRESGEMDPNQVKFSLLSCAVFSFVASIYLFIKAI